MKKFRIAIIFMLAASLFVTVASASTKKFSDVVEGAWYYKSVDTLTSWGILDGYPDGTFRPSENMTVAQCIKIIFACSDSNPGEAESGHWATLYMAAAKEKGYTDPQEFPAETWDNPINRQQLAKISVRVMRIGQNEKDNPKAADFIPRITDWTTIPDEYKEYVGQNYAKGIVAGYSDGSFRGESLTTRAESSLMLIRTLSSVDRIAPRYGPYAK